MKCVILAGGRGTRISELSKDIPKPMITVLVNQLYLKLLCIITNLVSGNL